MSADPRFDGACNAATRALRETLGRIDYADFMRLRNEVDTVHSYARLFMGNASLMRELVELRAFRDAHPLPPSAKPRSVARTKSGLIRHAEAMAVFGEYCDRESARLIEKLRRMEAGTFDAPVRAADAALAKSNEAIGRRAAAMEATIDAPTPTPEENQE